MRASTVSRGMEAEELPGIGEKLVEVVDELMLIAFQGQASLIGWILLCK